ncbi:hypothetical protein B0O99DRAFT_515213 [Bisporella sp. PMI_857]|nr:hypothetical protein B0O99DRAFT_515213 [Bisporella sp. PMI_857]
MATTSDQESQNEFSDSDSDSIDSNQTDDGQTHLPEKILAEVVRPTTFDVPQIWYLIKWEDCALLRSSWEGIDFAENFPDIILADWEAEKKRQLEGKSKPLDLEAFHQALKDLESAERARRRIRRLRSKVSRVLSIAAA